VTFDGEPESLVLLPAAGAESDEHGVRAAGEVQSRWQVPAASQRQLRAVIDDEHVRATVGRRLKDGVSCNAHQQTLVALSHYAADTF